MNAEQLEIARFGLVIARLQVKSMGYVAQACEQKELATLFVMYEAEFAKLAEQIASGEIRSTEKLEAVAECALELENVMQDCIPNETILVHAKEQGEGLLVTATQGLREALAEAGFTK